MRMISMICLFLCVAPTVAAQGKINFWVFRHPTRIGSVDGPLAGPEIYGQLLVGPTPNSLEPIWMAISHFQDGTIAAPGLVTVSNVPCESFAIAYVQMVAWDSRLWGTNLAGVPVDQLGRTDVVPHELDCGVDPAYSAPQFTMAAIVPIPEPPPWALALLAAPLLWMGQCLLRMNEHGRQFRPDANHGDTKARKARMGSRKQTQGGLLSPTLITST